GVKDVAKRATRTAANGLIAAVLDGTSAGVLVELNCETDFVAKTDLFQGVAADITAAALAQRAADRLAGLALEVRRGVTAQRRIAEQITRDEGKPEQAIPKIVEGRLGSFFKEVALIEQPFVKEPKKTIKQMLSEQGATVRAFARFQIGQAG